jgi:two-component system phosphate regulon sensor histidine kinase PhoR
MGHVEILNNCQIEEETLWRRSLGFVASETERLARLVEDLLSLSRLDRAPLHLQSVNLRLAAEEAISALFEAAERNNVSLILKTPAELPRVRADSGSTVTVQLEANGGLGHVQVSDTGPGISTEDLPHLFEPFYRRERTAPGTSGIGLGLTIVHSILNQHNAPIRVHSLPGQGTTFAFSLPLAHPEEAPSI